MPEKCKKCLKNAKKCRKKAKTPRKMPENAKKCQNYKINVSPWAPRSTVGPDTRLNHHSGLTRRKRLDEISFFYTSRCLWAKPIAPMGCPEHHDQLWAQITGWPPLMPGWPGKNACRNHHFHTSRCPRAKTIATMGPYSWHMVGSYFFLIIISLGCFFLNVFTLYTLLLHISFGYRLCFFLHFFLFPLVLAGLLKI